MPLVLGIVVLPFYTLQQFLLWVGAVTLTTYKEMITSLLIILAILLTDMIDFIDMFTDLVEYISLTAGYGLETLEQYNYVVWTLAAGYLVLVCLWWGPRSGGYYPLVEWVAMPIWALIIATMISYLGQWRDLIAICVFSVLGCGTYAALISYRGNDSVPEAKGSSASTTSASTTTGTTTSTGAHWKIKQVRIEEEGEDVFTPVIKKRMDLIREVPHSSSTPINTPAPSGFTTPAPSRFSTPAPNKTRYQTPATSRRPIKQASLKFLENNNRINTDKYFILLAWTVLFTLIGRDVFFVLRLSCLFCIFLAACQLYKFLGLTQR